MSARIVVARVRFGVLYITAFPCWASQWELGGDANYPLAAQRLVLTLAGEVNTNASVTAVNAVAISILASGGLTNAAGTSQAMHQAFVNLAGTWGDASQPSFLTPVREASTVLLSFVGFVVCCMCACTFPNCYVRVTVPTTVHLAGCDSRWFCRPCPRCTLLTPCVLLLVWHRAGCSRSPLRSS